MNYDTKSPSSSRMTRETTSSRPDAIQDYASSAALSQEEFSNAVSSALMIQATLLSYHITFGCFGPETPEETQIDWLGLMWLHLGSAICSVIFFEWFPILCWICHNVALAALTYMVVRVYFYPDPDRTDPYGGPCLPLQ